MITALFLLPPSLSSPDLVRKVKLPVIPSIGDTVCLDEELFKVKSLSHIVSSYEQTDQETYVASILLESRKDN